MRVEETGPVSVVRRAPWRIGGRGVEAWQSSCSSFAFQSRSGGTQHCSACCRGRGLSLGDGLRGLWVLGATRRRGKKRLPVLIERDRKSEGIWSHCAGKGCDAPIPCKGSDDRSGFHGLQENRPQGRSGAWALLSSVTLSRMAGTARKCLKHLQRARARATERSSVQSSPCTYLRAPLESRSPLLAWQVDLLLLFHKGEPHGGHTAYMRLKGKPWRVEMSSFGKCVDCRKRTRHKLETRWSGGVLVGVRCHGRDRDLCCAICETSPRRATIRPQTAAGGPLNTLEPKSTDLPEPSLIIPQLPDVEPAPTKTYHSDNGGTRNVFIRKADFENFGYSAGCAACEVHRAGLPMSGQGHIAKFRKRLEDAMTTDENPQRPASKQHV